MTLPAGQLPSKPPAWKSVLARVLIGLGTAGLLCSVLLLCTTAESQNLLEAFRRNFRFLYGTEYPAATGTEPEEITGLVTLAVFFLSGAVLLAAVFWRRRLERSRRRGSEILQQDS